MEFSLLRILGVFALYFALAKTQEECGQLLPKSDSLWNNGIPLTNGETRVGPQFPSGEPFVKGVGVTQGCRLLLKNQGGEGITFLEDFNDLSMVGFYRWCMSWVPVSWNPWSEEPIASACCQCGRCEDASVRLFQEQEGQEGICAKLFEGEDCDMCSGSSQTSYGYSFGGLGGVHDIRIGQEIPFCWARAGSILVKPGCTLTLFNRPSYSGDQVELNGAVNVFKPPQGWEGQRVCSYRCSCGSSNQYTQSNALDANYYNY